VSYIDTKGCHVCSISTKCHMASPIWRQRMRTGSLVHIWLVFLTSTI